MRSLAFLACFVVAGCAHLVPVQPMAGIPGVVRVSVRKTSGDTIQLEVTNESSDTLLVQRDGILLRDPSGARPRMRGGFMSSYILPPGGHHDVNLRYDLAKLQKGAETYIDFNGAISSGGAPLPVEPLRIGVE